MKHYNSNDLKGLDKIFRSNLINSCTGYKSANLIATSSASGDTNVAVFNSVIHIGSDPAILGFLLRPVTIPRNTFQNIKATGVFTVNHIHNHMIGKAHQTAAKYEAGVSEFRETGLEEEYLDEFGAPYVKESTIKMGCRYINEYQIKENNTLLILGEIQNLYFEEGIQMPDGWLRLDDADTVAINGLDGYALPTLIDRFHYARPGKEITSFFKK
ncbi:flavin reductase [Antarcticibacterium flavum]|uniref:Flavin reductase n=1 Tax=Antarcticibacterium flavum TaxID=2058175 RepID=A0A5B7X4S4_9FLAO|nr:MULTISPECIES: flavin reductase [Antarcticibacterium]MCM4160026.1 flavin oxidoreductase [Antarcticibacterium sp. W02-3]QCY70387.1 flavin reductase [Antarcticibacterium flavum]